MPRVLIPMAVQKTRVNIYDWQRDSERDDRALPRAVILRPDPEGPGIRYTPIETIDMIRLVEKNPSAIAHLAVQVAIRRWAGLVRYYYHLPAHAGRITVRSRFGEYDRGSRSSHVWYTIAATNLRRIGGEAILKGAQERALSKEVAVWIHHGDALNDQHQYLFAVWTLLGEANRHLRRPSELLKRLRDQLESMNDDFPPVYRSLSDGEQGALQEIPEPADEQRKVALRPRLLQNQVRVSVAELAVPVFAFLRSDQGRTFLEKRGKRRSIRAAFDSWHLKRDPLTLAKYRRKANREFREFVSESQFDREALLHPTIFNSYHGQDLFNWSNPYECFFPSLTS